MVSPRPLSSASPLHSGAVIRFQLYALIGGVSKLITLKAGIGPGNDGEPVITIMWPHED